MSSAETSAAAAAAQAGGGKIVMRRHRRDVPLGCAHHHHHHLQHHHHGGAGGGTGGTAGPGGGTGGGGSGGVSGSRRHGTSCSPLEVALLLRRHAAALAGPPQLNLKMGSIPGATPGVDINYNKPGSVSEGSVASSVGSSVSNPFSPIGSPSSPSCKSWEESMMQLSRDLQIICRSPDRYDMPVFPMPATAGVISGATASPVSAAVPHVGAGQQSSPQPHQQQPASGPTSPTTLSTGATPPSPASSLAAAEALRHSAGSAELGKLLSIRHVQSEEKLREKLTYICRSPRRSRSSTSSSDGDGSGKVTKSSAKQSPTQAAAAAARGSKRRAAQAFPTFKTSVDIGDHTIEDLCVIIEDHKLKVYSERKNETSSSGTGRVDLPTIIALPPEVNPQKLICIVRDGVLEVKESKRKCPPVNKVLGRQLSMSCTSSALRSSDALLRGAAAAAASCKQQHGETDECPIVIEDDGSHLLKLVLRVPPGYKFNDLQIKTVDNQLIVTGSRGPQRSYSASFTPPQWDKENSGGRHCSNDDSFVKLFELPSSVDPFSITARLTDQHQLIIQATLSPRTRSNTM